MTDVRDIRVQLASRRDEEAAARSECDAEITEKARRFGVFLRALEENGLTREEAMDAAKAEFCF